MVHLGKVPNDKDLQDTVASRIGEIDLGDSTLGDNEFTTSVYGSRFAAMDLPRHEMPEDEMPKEIAYRMIKWVDSITPRMNDRQ